jgi:preprotein translocase subunit SecD
VIAGQTTSTGFFAVGLLALTFISACDANATRTLRGGEHDLLSFHWPIEQPGPDVRMCVIAATGQQIALDRDPIIGVREFERAYLSTPDAHFVTVQLTPSGRTTLAEATSARIGQRLAIVVDDQVVALPVITQSLDVPELPLVPQMSAASADSLAKRINDAISRSRKRD